MTIAELLNAKEGETKEKIEDLLARPDTRSMVIRGTAERYGCMFVDMRTKWCRMLLEKNIPSGEMLRDGIEDFEYLTMLQNAYGKDTVDLIIKRMDGTQEDEETEAYNGLLLLDVGFYYRGLRYLIGHLMDFRGK